MGGTKLIDWVRKAWLPGPAVRHSNTTIDIGENRTVNQEREGEKMLILIAIA